MHDQYIGYILRVNKNVNQVNELLHLPVLTINRPRAGSLGTQLACPGPRGSFSLVFGLLAVDLESLGKSVSHEF